MLPEAAKQSLPPSRKKRPRSEAVAKEPAAKVHRTSTFSANEHAERSSPAQHSQRQVKKLRPRSASLRSSGADVPASANLDRRALAAAEDKPAKAVTKAVPGSTVKLQDGDGPGWICGQWTGVTQVGVQPRPQPQPPKQQLAKIRQVGRLLGPRLQAQPVRPEAAAQTPGGHPQRRRTSAPAPPLEEANGACSHDAEAAPQKLDAARTPSNNKPLDGLSGGRPAAAPAPFPDGTPVKMRASPTSPTRGDRSSGRAEAGRRYATDCVAAEATPRRSPRAVVGAPAGPVQGHGSPAKAPVSTDTPAVTTTPRRSPRRQAPQQGGSKRGSRGSEGGAVSPTAAAAEAAARLANVDWFDPLNAGKVQCRSALGSHVCTSILAINHDLHMLTLFSRFLWRRLL